MHKINALTPRGGGGGRSLDSSKNLLNGQFWLLKEAEIWR